MDMQHYIRAQDNRSVIVDRDEDGLSLSVHAIGAHVLCTLDRAQAIELLNTIQSIIEDQS